MFIEIKTGLFVDDKSKEGKAFIKARRAKAKKEQEAKAKALAEQEAKLKAERVAELKSLLDEAKK